MSGLTLSRRHWVLTDDQYRKLKEAHRPIPIPIQLAQTQTKFVEDRLQNKNQNEALWASVADKIQSILSTHLPKAPHAFPPPPQSAVISMTSTPLPAISQRDYLDQQRREARDQQRRYERSLEEEAIADPSSTSRASTVPAAADEELGTVAPQSQPSAANVTRLIYQQIKAPYQNRANRIYSELLALPGVSVGPERLSVDGLDMPARTIEILDNLARRNKTLKFNIEPLLERMSIVPYMISIVGNEAAIKRLEDMKDDSAAFESAILAQSRRTSTPNKSASFQSVINPGGDGDETLTQRGSGGGLGRPRLKIKWDSLF